MANNLSKTYHKGRYRDRDWAKHLKPFGKRLGNKRFRKTGKNILGEEDPFAPNARRIRIKKKRNQRIKVKITHSWGDGEYRSVEIKTFARLRDAQNSLNRHSVLRYEFLKR
jgi:hypothetical protein